MKVPPALKSRGTLVALGCLASGVGGLLLGWWLWHSAPVVETAAPAKVLPSGGIVVERKPEAPVPPPTKQAAKEAGGKPERSVSVTVRPNSTGASQAGMDKAGQVAGNAGGAGSNPAAGNRAPPCECAPVTVDLGLIRMPDKSRRVVATATGGTILSAIDIPLESPSYPKSLKWAVGVTVSYDMSQGRALGGFVDRDLGPFRVGLELSQRDGGTATVKAGIRF